MRDKSENNSRSVSLEQARKSHQLNSQGPQNSTSTANRQNSLVNQIYFQNFSRLKSDERIVGQISAEDEKLENIDVINIENTFCQDSLTAQPMYFRQRRQLVKLCRCFLSRFCRRLPRNIQRKLKAKRCLSFRSVLNALKTSLRKGQIDSFESTMHEHRMYSDLFSTYKYQLDQEESII